MAEPSTRVIVKNVPYRITEARLRKIWQSYDFTDFKMIYKADGRFRGIVFVGFYNVEDAQAFIKKADKTYIDTSKIEVSFAYPISQNPFQMQQQPPPPPVLSKLQLSSDCKELKSEEVSGGKNDKDKRTVQSTFSELEIDEDDEIKFKEFLELHNVKPDLSRATFTKKEKKADETETGEVSRASIEKIAENYAADDETKGDIVLDTGRLFIRNLPYSCDEQSLQEFFKSYGPVEYIHISRDAITGALKGYGFVKFCNPEDALMALNHADGTFLQGRIIHILPSKPELTVDMTTSENLSFKSKKIISKKNTSKPSSNEWNTLFLGTKATTDIISKELNVSKEKFMESNKNDLTSSVRLALAETAIVNETKKFLQENGINLEAIINKNSKRSDDTLIAKNLPCGTTEKQLASFIKTKLYHNVDDENDENIAVALPRIILPPHGITAVLIFSSPIDAKKAFKVLYFTKFMHVPLYLEWAPINSYYVNVVGNNLSLNTNNNPMSTSRTTLRHMQSTVIYVKNLNFKTVEKTIEERFNQVGQVLKVVISKARSKESGKLMSQGYGFIQFSTHEEAKTCIKQLQNTILDGHALVLKMSNSRKIMNAVYADNEETITTGDDGSARDISVILVRNVPFEADKNELEQLFSTFGNVRKVRLPSKLHGKNKQHRGFAFVEFMTKQEAKRAFDALCHSTHLYGRRLVLEWASQSNSLQTLRKRAALDQQSVITSQETAHKMQKVDMHLDDE